MKIAIVAANGRVAKKVIDEALSRGHEVVAFGRHAENDTPAKNPPATVASTSSACVAADIPTNR